jgi:hypothetical protein
VLQFFPSLDQFLFSIFAFLGRENWFGHCRQAFVERVPGRAPKMLSDHLVSNTEWACRRAVDLGIVCVTLNVKLYNFQVCYLQRCVRLLSGPPHNATGYYCFCIAKVLKRLLSGSVAIKPALERLL